MQSRELIKLYYRIGEVSDIVGVQPHVLRYWETEFRTIRPQKSSKGQRVYSRRDVEKLLRVKDLLKNQGFTIAGARKRLSEPGARGPDEAPEVDHGAKNMRKVLLGLRQDLMRMLDALAESKP
jgi:DNA-binding transcriptional MerR regulator